MVQQQANRSNTFKAQDVTAQNDGYVVGVDIGGTNLRLALADLTGAVVAKWSTTTVGVQDADKVVRLIRGGVEHMLQQTSKSYSQLRAIAAGAPGITDVDAGVVIATSYLLGWRDVPLRKLLEDTFHVPAVVDNDVNIAAIGESWAGAAVGVRDFVFIAIGTGLGAGIVLNGHIFRGMGWNAGEIGYMLVPGVSSESADPGKPGALESVIGGEGIREQWRRYWIEGKSLQPEELTATQVFDLAVKKDPVAMKILDNTAKLLASAIHNISLILNCPLFVLGGRVGIHPALFEATRSTLAQWTFRVRSQLKLSHLGTDAQLIGAIRMALDAAGDPSNELYVQADEAPQRA